MELNKQNVEFIMGACNPTAVANQLARWSADVIKDGGTDAAKRHPLLRVVVGKLADLYGVDHDGTIYHPLYLDDLK
jgi:hypothetical protein